MADAIAELIDIDGIEPAGRLALAFGIVGLAEASARHWSLGGSGLSLVEVVEHVSDLAWYACGPCSASPTEPRLGQLLGATAAVLGGGVMSIGSV